MTFDVQSSGAAARAIEILSDLVGFDTVSTNSNLVMMEYIAALLERQGITAELLFDADEPKANLFASVGPVRPGGVILSGHSDVVPIADQKWTSDPFTLTRRDGKLFGRGAADMKAFIACSLAAVELADLKALERPIYLAFSYDEEVGCLGSPALIERLSVAIPTPATAIVGEPSLMRIIASHKSVGLYKVRVTGVPAHSSAPHLGISANSIAIRLMGVLLQVADRLMEPDMRNLDFMPSFSTLTIGQMQGGTAANILAAEAGFVFDLRCLPEHDPADILEPFHAALDALGASHPGATIEFEQSAAVPALARVSEGDAEALVRRIGGDNSDLLTASFGAEAGQFQGAGFSTVICGPGSIDQAHQPDEFIEVEEIDKCMRFMATLFLEMREAAAPGRRQA